MKTTEDVITVAARAGEYVWVHARGNPAILVAGAVVAASVAVGYGSYKYGNKFLNRMGWN